MKLSNKAKKNFEEDNEFYIKLGERLRQARRTKVNEFTGKETIIPLTKVAKALKNTYQQIGKYEKGENRIPLVNLVKISKFLKKPLSYFLDDYNEIDKVAEEFNIAYEKERDNFYKEHQKTLGTK
jgi:transcriptional regulator with XRE-family HTH domain|tara:strand:- start:335 stop:709 length:375 start_codon:yes stop_codon:yes gene_type:complete